MYYMIEKLKNYNIIYKNDNPSNSQPLGAINTKHIKQ